MAPTARGDGFDPEDEGFDLGRLARTVLWGAGAILAVGGAMLAAQSETGSRRLALALNGFPPGGQEASKTTSAATRQARTAPADAETRRLSETVTSLMADRDRLIARLDALERSSDVTGSIPPQPAVTPPATNLMAAGNPSAPVPPQVAVRSELTAAQDTGAMDSVATKTEFGVDIGRDTTLDGLRGVWAALKTQHAGLLDGLRPVVSVREGGKPGTVELRLIAGPLPNAALAARLCATLGGVGLACQPTTFDGQRLAMR